MSCLRKRGRTRALEWALCAMACSGLLLRGPAVQAAAPQHPTGASAPTPTTAGLPAPEVQPAATDIELGPGGLLRGMVVDAQGMPVAGVTVTVVDTQQPVAQVVTDEWGRFEVASLRGGTYFVVAEQGFGQFRLWTAGTAPPAAQHAALIVTGDEVVRGQFCIPPLKFWLADPLVIAAIVAAAVAIPVAVHNHRLDKDQPASP